MAVWGSPWYRASADTWYTTRPDGRLVSLRVRGRANEAEAWRAWERLRLGVLHTPAAPIGNATVGELVTAYLTDAVDRVKPNTVKVYGFLLRPWAATQKGDAASVNPADVTAYSRRRSWSADTRNTFIGTVCAAYRWGVRAKLIPSNPLAGMSRPSKVSRGAGAVMSSDDVGKLLAASKPPLAAMLRLLHATGARPGELSALTAADVDLVHGVARLVEHKTAAATGAVRLIFFPPAAVELLRPLAAKYPTGPVLRKLNGKPWDVDSLYQAIRKARKRAGVPHATAYGFRHTFATDALANGVPDAHVAELLGHAGTA